MYEARPSEMDWMLKKTNHEEGGNIEAFVNFVSISRTSLASQSDPPIQDPQTDNIVRMRGLPYEAGPNEICAFFEGIVNSALVNCEPQGPLDPAGLALLGRALHCLVSRVGNYGLRDSYL